jgi:hypothetical protein
LKIFEIFRASFTPFFFVFIFDKSLSGAKYHCLYRSTSCLEKTMLPSLSLSRFSLGPNRPSAPVPKEIYSQEGNLLCGKNGFNVILSQ